MNTELKPRGSVAGDILRSAQLLLVVVVIAVARVITGDASVLGGLLLVAFGLAVWTVFIGGPLLIGRLGDRPVAPERSDRRVDLARAACSVQRVLAARAAHVELGGIEDVSQRVRPPVAAALWRREGLDLDDPTHQPAINAVLGPDAMAVLGITPPPLGRHQFLSSGLDACADYLTGAT